MDTIKAIMTRRSIRTFKEKPISKAYLKIILAAAMNAPSSFDSRPWEFMLITDKAKRFSIAKEIDEDKPMFKKAPVTLLMCGNPAKERTYFARAY